MNHFRIICCILLSWIIISNVNNVWCQNTSNFRYTDTDKPKTIDPITVDDISSVKLTEILFSSLYRKNRFNELIPELADGDPQIQDGGKIVIVKLKSGLMFSDGSPLTVDDVIFTYLAATNEKSENYNRGFFDNIKSMTANGNKINVEFKNPVANSEAAKPYLAFFIIPKSMFINPIINKQLSYCREPDPVSGGFELAERTATGDKYSFRRNQYYRSRDSVAFEQITLSINPDIRGHYYNLVGGHVDMVPYLYPEFVPDIRARQNSYTIEKYDANQYDFIAFNFQNELIQIRQFRQALNLAFNRGDILASYYLNDGTLMSGPLPPSHWGNNPDVEPWPYDPEKAKSLLDEVGIIDNDTDGIREYNNEPLSFILVLPSLNDANIINIIGAFRQEMQAIGINIEYEQLGASLYESRIKNGDFDLAFVSRKVTPDGDYAPYFTSSQAFFGGKNIGFYQNSTVDELFSRVKYESDSQIRIQLYRRIHQILKEECPYIYLWYLERHTAYVNRLRNVSIDPFFFFSTIEDWYFQDEK